MKNHCRGLHRASFFRAGKWRIYVRDGRTRGSALLWSVSADTKEQAEAIEQATCTPAILKARAAECTQARFAARNGRLEELAEACWRGAQLRAPARGIEFRITLDEVLDILRAQRFRCALSGEKFQVDKAKGTTRAPFRPSLDRIKPERGYVSGNVRWVLCAVNIGRSDFGDAVLIQIARGVAANG